MGSGSRIRLLEADPGVAVYLTQAERGEAATLTVPVVELEPGPVDTGGLVARHASFGAIVIEGMLACHLRVGEQAGMRILGPRDAVSLGATESPMLLVDAGCRAVAPTRLAMLGRDVLVGVHRWPRLMAGLHVRTAEQIERVAVQLAICQLPRVEDRLLALFWLLAESWGRVTPVGTALPLVLTHETLGALVGARRPTVTLALGELTERGAVLRQGRTWLLIEHPPVPERAAPDPHAPVLVTDGESVWGRREEVPETPGHVMHEEIARTIERLREQHRERADQVLLGLARVREARLRSEQLRSRIRRERPVRAPRPPS